MSKGRLERLEHRRAPDDHDALEAALQQRLYRVQVAYLSQGRSAIIMLEGWDASGKGGLIKRLTSELDPRFFAVHPIAAPTEAERKRHFLYRFWTRLPGRGEIAIFDRSWYGRVAVERVEGYCEEAEWRRAYDEINDFEAGQVKAGTRVIKLFLHVSAEEQDARLRERVENPWKRWKTGADDYRNRSKREGYLAAYEAMFAKTDTKVAPWHLIGADHKKFARTEGMRIIAEALETGVDLSPPPLHPDLHKLADAALGPIDAG
ncbi:polyphosphate kinase 2 family protein [Sandaracinobacteroides saxicola]|uniref:Polyphosphate kinase n=1 Tax=Sandaracinobacteroides saxicola TaxID=2759707 RepID=A0A7G5IKQ4_9SPHN|nr:polyphosphate kinase [Sandaracinobacteroides saxicola]QMW23946.1 polyphosphate kinase [Sandaracinobacteroides saxicola]